VSARVAVASGAAVIVAVAIGASHPAAAECDPIGDSRFVGAGCHRIPVEAPNPRPKPPPAPPPDDGGNGSDSECHWEFGYTFDPADPSVDITANSSGRRQDYYDFICNGFVTDFKWVDSPAGGPAQQITAADMVPGVWVSVQRQLPKPVARTR
jgi:hypothetical protein